MVDLQMFASRLRTAIIISDVSAHVTVRGGVYDSNVQFSRAMRKESVHLLEHRYAQLGHDDALSDAIVYRVVCTANRSDCTLHDG